MIRAVLEPGERTSPITAPTMERARTTITTFVQRWIFSAFMLNPLRRTLNSANILTLDGLSTGPLSTTDYSRLLLLAGSSPCGLHKAGVQRPPCWACSARQLCRQNVNFFD